MEQVAESGSTHGGAVSTRVGLHVTALAGVLALVLVGCGAFGGNSAGSPPSTENDQTHAQQTVEPAPTET